MHLTDEEKKIGRDNYSGVMDKTLAPNRREFFATALASGAAITAGVGAVYYGYDKKLGDPLRVGIIGTGDEGSVLIGALNPDFVQVKAIADIRPYSVYRAFHGDQEALDARPGLMSVYGWKTDEEARKNVKVYEKDYKELLADPEIEAVIIALPLWIHDVAAIEAMRAGKHVLTEKLMAHSIHQCKEMARVAYQTNKLLATGHQRHYSVLYDNAVDTIRRGIIGDIHHIRAQWHRGNLPGKDSWQPSLPIAMISEEEMRKLEKEADAAGGKDAVAELRRKYQLVREIHAWNKQKKEKKDAKGQSLSTSQLEKLAKQIAQKEAQLQDLALDAKQYGYEDAELPGGYQRSAMEELIRWRLFNRTGGGLMAELGSHQLDASGIFISSQFDGKAKVRPLSVVGVGGRHIFPADRDVDDHVYCMYEYPGKGYFKNNDPTTEEIADPNKKVVVTYSSINGNGYGGYGEVVLGTKGTLILDREQETMLFGGGGTKTSVQLNAAKSALDSYETGGGSANLAAAALSGPISRGYTEEIEHWAWCIRNNYPIEELHCHPKVALADAVIALTSNIAMAENRRIEFKPEWFDPESDETPEGVKPKKADEIA
ncbi:MAG: Gfo/Idh/MocA family oxidoreductase [Pirellulales bacterium]